jgi:outer membrane protein
MSYRILVSLFFAAAVLCVGQNARAEDGRYGTVVYSDPFQDPLDVFPVDQSSSRNGVGEFASTTCPSGANLATPLSVDDAIDIALCNNPQLKSAWAAIKVQAAQLGQAKAAYLPVVSLTASRMRTGTTYPGSGISSTTTSGEEYYGTLNWRLFDFGGRAANVNSSKALLDASVYQHAAALQKTIQDAVQTYFDCRNAKVELLARRDDESIAANILASAKRRELEGISSHGDVLQASTRMLKATLETNKALVSFRKSVATLIYAMGLPPDSNIDVPAEGVLMDGASPIDESKKLQSWLDDASAMHPGILAAKARAQAAEYSIDVARSDGMPTVDFSANNYQNGYPGQGLQVERTRVNTVGFSVTIPLFDGFSHTYKVRAAQAQAQQRAEDERDVEHSVALDIVKSYEEVSASSDILRTAEELFAAARESLDSAQRRYDKGAADISELLNAQAALADARQEKFQQQLGFESARLRLIASAGKFSTR